MKRAIELSASVAVTKISPQGDCVLKPRVVAMRLPWVLDCFDNSTPMGLRLYGRATSWVCGTISLDSAIYQPAR